MKQLLFVMMMGLLLSSCSQPSININNSIEESAALFKKKVDEGREKNGYYTVARDIDYDRTITYYDLKDNFIAKTDRYYGSFVISGDIYEGKEYNFKTNNYKYCEEHDIFDKNSQLVNRTFYYTGLCLKDKLFSTFAANINNQLESKEILEANKYFLDEMDCYANCLMRLPECFHYKGELGENNDNYVLMYTFQKNIFREIKDSTINDYHETNTFDFNDDTYNKLTQYKITNGKKYKIVDVTRYSLPPYETRLTNYYDINFFDEVTYIEHSGIDKNKMNKILGERKYEAQ